MYLHGFLILGVTIYGKSQGLWDEEFLSSSGEAAPCGWNRPGHAVRGVAREQCLLAKCPVLHRVSKIPVKNSWQAYGFFL